MRTAFCRTCNKNVRVEWWQSDTDPGEAGYVRECCHGDYVPTAEQRLWRPVG